MVFSFSCAVFAKIDVVYEQPPGCRILEVVSATNLPDQQQAIDKLVNKVKRERGDTLVVLAITPVTVMVDDNTAKTRYDIEGLALDCER